MTDGRITTYNSNYGQQSICNKTDLATALNAFGDRFETRLETRLCARFDKQLDKRLKATEIRIEKRMEKMVGEVVGDIVSDALQMISERFDRIEEKLDATCDIVAHHTIDIAALQRKAG